MKKKHIIKYIIKKCSICNKQMKIIIYNDKSYRNGHYFGTIKIPIGKGKNIKVDTIKISDKKYDVVKWSGKEKEAEYWECAKCFWRY